MYISLIIPVFNRPDELDELLASAVAQTGSVPPFEMVIVEDGSTLRAQEVTERYADRLTIQYIEVPNGGPAKARNIGAAKARGKYLLILDSDVVLPTDFLHHVQESIASYPCDAWGGPDAAGKGFSVIQRAIGYTMTSFLTTGGIRGGKRSLEKFKPRSFNLGCRVDVYRALGGFSEDMRFGEDIDFSLRLSEAGYTTRLYPDCAVFHKRRVSLKSFFKQVHNSGRARIDLGLRHPGSTKPVHALPALFTLGMTAVLVLTLAHTVLWLYIPLLFSLIIFADAWRTTHSSETAEWAIPAAWIQLVGYGSGFCMAFWRMRIQGKGVRNAFDRTFYDK